jgi:hypothetical protein
MSNPIRRIQRSVKRAKNYLGRGSRLGVHNKEAKDLVARLAREEKKHELLDAQVQAIQVRTEL